VKELHLVDTRTINEAISLLNTYWGKQKYVEHYNAKTIEEAVSLLDWYKEEANVIAGGVDLISLMKKKVMLPRVLVNIKTIPDLAYIKEEAEGLKIGTLTTIHDIEVSAIIKDKYSLLVEAAHSVAAPQVRNMATMGGNLCQGVRCWYYRRSPVTGRSFFCRRKGGEQCYAVNGDNTYHAIIGGGECHAVCPSDMAPALIALNAKVKIAGQDGDRIIPLEEFYTVMGNVLSPNEIIREIQVPSPEVDTKQRYLKFRLRKTIDFAISSVAAVITTEAGRVSNARIVLGGVAPTPHRSIAAEETIKGKMLTENAAEIAAKEAASAAVPLSMNAYKLPITKALVKRAIIE